MTSKQLTDYDVVALRKGIRELLDAGVEPSGIVKVISQKFGLHPRDLVEHFEAVGSSISSALTSDEGDAKEASAGKDKERTLANRLPAGRMLELRTSKKERRMRPGQKKLSPRQKQALRAKMRRLQKHGKEMIDIVRTISKDYKVTDTTARWYYKDEFGAKAAPAGKRKSPKAGTSKAAARRPKAAPSAVMSPATVDGSEILDQAKQFAQRAALVGQLSAKLQTKLQHLRKQESAVQTTRAEVKQLQDRIAEVVRN